MQQQILEIKDIPAILWGPKSDLLFITIHGDQSNKADDIIKIFAQEAVLKGYQVLSFDLPEHGDRKENPRLCNPQNCTVDLQQVMHYARTNWAQISVFGCSLGAYFGMLAYSEDPVRQALFLSPVVDMKRLIENIMMWFNVSKKQLQAQQKIDTPVKTLYWDYYQHVLQHPVKWSVPTALLYGRKDTLCEFETIQQFVKNTSAEMTVFEEGEHFFHTEKQLSYFKEWLDKSLL